MGRLTITGYSLFSGFVKKPKVIIVAGVDILDTIIREMHVIYFVKLIRKLKLDYREGGTNHDNVPNIFWSCPLLHKEQTIMTPSSLNKLFCTNISKTLHCCC